MEIGEKIKLIREAENLSRDDFARETGIKFQTLVNYESGRRASVASDQLQKITNSERFSKYTLWLLNGTTAPESGQISPEIEQERDTG